MANAKPFNRENLIPSVFLESNSNVRSGFRKKLSGADERLEEL
jgi:hypothetical protein